jgi:hypothetical protein
MNVWSKSKRDTPHWFDVTSRPSKWRFVPRQFEQKRRRTWRRQVKYSIFVEMQRIVQGTGCWHISMCSWTLLLSFFILIFILITSVEPSSILQLFFKSSSKPSSYSPVNLPTFPTLTNINLQHAILKHPPPCSRNRRCCSKRKSMLLITHHKNQNNN